MASAASSLPVPVSPAMYTGASVVAAFCNIRCMACMAAPSPIMSSPPALREWHGLSSGDSAARSEEHTSELQSLMRKSYADFCLKKQHLTHRDRLESTRDYAQHQITTTTSV